MQVIDSCAPNNFDRYSAEYECIIFRWAFIQSSLVYRSDPCAFALSPRLRLPILILAWYTVEHCHLIPRLLSQCDATSSPGASRHFNRFQSHRQALTKFRERLGLILSAHAIDSQQLCHIEVRLWFKSLRYYGTQQLCTRGVHHRPRSWTSL